MFSCSDTKKNISCKTTELIDLEVKFRFCPVVTHNQWMITTFCSLIITLTYIEQHGMKGTKRQGLKFYMTLHR